MNNVQSSISTTQVRWWTNTLTRIAAVCVYHVITAGGVSSDGAALQPEASALQSTSATAKHTFSARSARATEFVPGARRTSNASAGATVSAASVSSTASDTASEAASATASEAASDATTTTTTAPVAASQHMGGGTSAAPRPKVGIKHLLSTPLPES